jgi:glycerol-3-phosphate cytidylyltransferase
MTEGAKDYTETNGRVVLNESSQLDSCEEPKDHAEAKRYGVGTTVGVFDLFHVGNLNLLERAKECCDFLRVGVITDEVVQVFKGFTPVIPFEQRARIVRAIHCVDEVVPIDDDRLLSKVEQWYQQPFDCVFSGDDHEGDEFWVEEERVLAQLGVDVVYLPYTDTISSTKIRGALRAKGAESDRR